jgi:tRNA(fMet)-specific endonuclease VapC
VKRYMLDTDISSYIIRKRPEPVRARFREVESAQLCLSVVSEAELLYGVTAKGSPRALASMVADFLRRLTILDWSRAAARHYADIRAKLESDGTPIGNMDLMIAAHARSTGAVLVTNNEKHFRRIPGLKVENWASA